MYHHTIQIFYEELLGGVGSTPIALGSRSKQQKPVITVAQKIIKATIYQIYSLEEEMNNLPNVFPLKASCQ